MNDVSETVDSIQLILIFIVLFLMSSQSSKIVSRTKPWVSDLSNLKRNQDSKGESFLWLTQTEKKSLCGDN